MSFARAKIKSNKRIFERSMDLTKAIEICEMVIADYSGETYFSLVSEDKARDLLRFAASLSDEVVLPSGRRGNAIALALELHCYNAAADLMVYADAEKSEPNVTVVYDGCDSWSLAEEIIYSLLTKCEEPYESDAASFIDTHLSNIISPRFGIKLDKEKSIDMLRKSLFDNERYEDTAEVLAAFERYNDGEIDILRKLFTNNGRYRNTDLLLPSGRIGNALALAFEMNYYGVAEYIMDHAVEFGMLPSVVIKCDEPEGRWPTPDEFLYSLLTFDEVDRRGTIDYIKDNFGQEEADKALIRLEAEKAAVERIAGKLGLTDKQLGEQGYMKTIVPPTGD